MKKEHRFYVYGLVDPVHKVIRYVGTTYDSIHRRYQAHKSSGSTCGSKPMFLNGQRPEVVILETVYDEDILPHEREIKWMHILNPILKQKGLRFFNKKQGIYFYDDRQYEIRYSKEGKWNERH